MSLSIKFPDEHYVGMVTRQQSGDLDYLPLAFATPNGTDKAAQKRRDSVDSWVNRQQNKLPPVVLKNEPLAGFRLLDDVRRDSSWGSGNVKWRVEDPRGFELEISSPNLMQILACSVVANKEILDRCMWAREGSENILVPVSSDVYKTAMENTERANKSASMRDIKIGDKAVMQNGEAGRYFGKLYVISTGYGWNGSSQNLDIKVKPSHVFVGDETILIIPSPKLSEIIPGEAMTKEAAEAELGRMVSTGYTIQGGGYNVKALSLSKDEPTVERFKKEMSWNERSRRVFEMNDRWYKTVNDYHAQVDIEYDEISKQSWEVDSKIISLHGNDHYWFHHHIRKIPLQDLLNMGIKCYTVFSRITLSSGTTFDIQH